jgi:hypothetical protein
MTRRILVLFPDEWDRAAGRDRRYAGRFEFLFEGFDLFRFPDNARLFTFDARRFVERMVRKYARARLDAVVTSDEQFGPFLASLIARRLGLAHTPLETVLSLQHKYYARRAFERIAPQANLRFGLLRRGYRREDVPLAFPFYVKPAKAAFSVLARRVDSFAELERHTRFGWLERRIIERLVQPFADVMHEYSALTEDPFSMVVEEIARGRQVTANGFAREGRITMLGTVDSVMYPGTDHFQRFQYPSTLPDVDLARVDALATRLAQASGFTHGMFNIEMRLDPLTGSLRVIEINPRVAGQFYDLFERVDGYSLFEAMLDLDSGRAPVIRHREGACRHAASFVLRDLSGEGLGRWPARSEIRALESRHPDVHVMIYPKRGVDLERELKWLGSYRYAIFNLGAASLEEMFARFHRLCAEISFHPRSHAAPDLEALLGEAAASGDD